MSSVEALWSIWIENLDSTQRSIVIAAIATLFILILTTKAFTGSSSTEYKNGQKVPLAASYSIPFLGHVPWLAWDTDGYLGGMRDRYPDGIFSMKMLGRMHHFIHKPSLASALFRLHQPAEEEKMLTSRLLEATFGVGKDDLARHNDDFPDAAVEHKYLLQEPGLSELTNTALWHVKKNIADFVTFNSHAADQTDWERLAEADVIEGTDKGDIFVEADLMELTRNFIAKTATPAMFGTDLVENFPDLWKWLWTFDEAFVLLAARVPAWLPWPRLQRGKLARRHILSMTYEFHEALEKHLNGEDPGAKWQDLDNVSRLVKGRAQDYKNHGISLWGRASLDLALVWATNANSNQLVSWMLYELYRDVVLLEDVREEIAPYITAVQPENHFGPAVWISPTLQDVDIDGLVTKCPLLKATYVETLRVYTGGWAMKWMSEDTVLEERGKAGDSFFLKKGTYAHIPHTMHNFDPKHYPSPNEWQAQRHIKEVIDDDGQKTRTADIGTLRPYGGGSKMCKGRHFALREMLLFTAVIITFYDIHPPKGQSWPIPETVKPVATRRPKYPLKVWIKRRELPLEKTKTDEKSEREE